MNSAMYVCGECALFVEQRKLTAKNEDVFYRRRTIVPPLTYKSTGVYNN